MATLQALMTVEKFWEQYAGQPYELVEGEVVPMPPTGFSHGSSSRRIAALLGSFVDEHQLGDVVGAETGFRLSETILRAPDAAFIGKDKLAAIADPDRFLPFASDLAVEVVSPDDSASDIQQKVDSYLAAGTALVWVVYPDLRKVVVHSSDGVARTMPEDGFLDGGNVLPGLRLAVSDLFPPRPAL